MSQQLYISSLIDKQDVIPNRNFGFGFGFGFGMLFLSVSVSVSVQTKPKFWYFGFGSNSGFGRSLVPQFFFRDYRLFPQRKESCVDDTKVTILFILTNTYYFKDGIGRLIE